MIGTHAHGHAAHDRGHAHGLVDPVLSSSVALLADLIHNVGDAPTAVPNPVIADCCAKNAELAAACVPGDLRDGRRA